MKKTSRRGVPLREWLTQELKDPEFRRLYEEASVKWSVALEIVEARERANLTQGQLAREIGDKQQNVSRIESGEQNVTIGTLDKIARAVGGRLLVKIVDSARAIDRGHSEVKDRRRPYRIGKKPR